MENLLNPHISCTDPDTLQFCLYVSNTEFWYCQASDLNDRIYPEAETTEKIVYDILCGNPDWLFSLQAIVTEIKEFISDNRLWYTGYIDAQDFTQEEKLEQLDNYGYSWNDFSSDTERNQIICECHFEENITEYENY